MPTVHEYGREEGRWLFTGGRHKYTRVMIIVEREKKEE